MSDFAPFVAAALQDKTMHELLEENKKLRARLKSCMTVEITGAEGYPIYASGDFETDGGYHGNPNLWNVNLQEVTPCPLSELRHVEVWIGGVVKTSFEGILAYGHEIFDDGEYDQDQKIYSVCMEPGCLWMEINIGWTDQEAEAANIRLPHHHEVEEPTEQIDYICGAMAEAGPDKVCKFRSISPLVSEFKKLVHSIPGSSNEELLSRHERMNAASDLLGRVMEALRGIVDDDDRWFRAVTVGRLRLAEMLMTTMITNGVQLQNVDAVREFIVNYQENHNPDIDLHNGEAILAFVANQP